MHNRIKGWLDKGNVRPEDYVGGNSSKNEEAVRSNFASKAKKYFKHLPMAREAVAMYFCMLDARTPLWVKGAVAAALAYFVMPADAIPDFLPVIGLGDDAGVLAATLTAVASHVTADHRDQARTWMEEENLEAAGA